MKTEEEIRERIELAEDRLKNDVGGRVDETFRLMYLNEISKEISALRWVLSD